MSSLDYIQKYLPPDLNIKVQPDVDKNFYIVTIPDLKVNTDYNFAFQWVFPDGSVSDFSPYYKIKTANYGTKLVAPTISASPASLAYIVSYPQQTDPNFAYISIEEVVTESTTAPTSGWSEVFTSSANPVLVPTGNKLKRWVRARLIDKLFGSTNYSSPVSVTPTDPADDFSDNTPPGEVTVTSAGWVGTYPNQEIQIQYTIPAVDGGTDFLIYLTGDSKTRFISEFPIGTSLNQTAKISLDTIKALFGENYPLTFTGVFKSVDKAKNVSTGTNFSIGGKPNGLAGYKPIVTPTAIANGFSLSWNLGNATYAKVYTSTTSGFTPNEAIDPQFSGAGPYIENTTTTTGFSTVYYRVKFFGPGLSDISDFSDEGFVTPLNPDITDTTPPAPITSATGVGGTNSEDPSGIGGQISISIVQPAVPADFAAYSVKIINGSITTYQEILSSSLLSSLTIKNGIYVGQQYTISIARRDKTNNYSAYVNLSNNPILVSDTRINTSVVTNLSVSATDSIATVSWSAPADTNVGSYKVMITSNADTSFTTPIQTIFTDSTQTSFGGLLASTTYRVRVITKYSNNGPLSTQNTDTTFTLNSSGAISDGIAPTTNPALTADMVKSLFGAFAITFPPVTNSDAVTYEVFIKPTDSTGIVSNTYKVLEVAGTFAVIRTLADKTTTLSYGTNYYIAIRAKDNDGVSTGSITAVGPVQTLQVQNADLAENSVYANNIFAGQIDASKMVTDLLFAEKTINVGESTSLNRIRLDANTIAAGTAGYTNPTDPIKSRMFIGAGRYNDSGTPVYLDNLGRFSLKNKLQFDGTDLQIDANGSFGGLLTAGPSGQAIKIGLAAGGGTNHGIYLDTTGDYIYNSGNFRLGAGKITYNGTLLDISSQVNITGSSTVSGDLGVTSAGATFYAGASKSSGNRVIMNSGGLFGYNGATINFSFPNSTGLFTLGTGEISGWSVNSGTIEKLTGSTYAGISTGTYAFYAGGGSAGSGSPLFKVTQSGALTANSVQITGGSLDIGAAWPTGGFHVDSSGVLKAKGATIAGALAIQGGSTFEGNIEVTSGSTIYMGSNTPGVSRVQISSGGIFGYSGANQIFNLNTSGTSSIAGWTLNAGSLSSSGMVLNSSDQTILFKNGFIMDNDTTTYNTVASNSDYSLLGEGDIETLYSTTSSTQTSSTATFAIKPSSGTGPKFALSTSNSGSVYIGTASTGGSSISLTSSGIVLESASAGAIAFKNFTNKTHLSFTGKTVAAMVMVKPDGSLSAGRSIFKSGASEQNIVTNNTHSAVGLIGDIILSTVD